MSPEEQAARLKKLESNQAHLMCLAWAAIIVSSVCIFLVFLLAHENRRRVDELWEEQHAWIELSNKTFDCIKTK